MYYKHKIFTFHFLIIIVILLSFITISSGFYLFLYMLIIVGVIIAIFSDIYEPSHYEMSYIKFRHLSNSNKFKILLFPYYLNKSILNIFLNYNLDMKDINPIFIIVKFKNKKDKIIFKNILISDKEIAQLLSKTVIKMNSDRFNATDTLTKSKILNNEMSIIINKVFEKADDLGTPINIKFNDFSKLLNKSALYNKIKSRNYDDISSRKLFIGAMNELQNNGFSKSLVGYYLEISLGKLQLKNGYISYDDYKKEDFQ